MKDIKKREELQQFAYGHPDKWCHRLSINTAIRAELQNIRIFIHMSDLPYFVWKVVNHTPSGRLWEIPFTCLVCEFIKHMWRLGLTCAKSQHVHVQRCWVSRVNSNLKKLHFEELGGGGQYIQSGEFSQYHYAAINTAIKTLQHNPRSSERERRKPRLTVR